MKKFITNLILISAVAFGVYYYFNRRNVSVSYRTRTAVENIKGNLREIGDEVSSVAKDAVRAAKEKVEDISTK